MKATKTGDDQTQDETEAESNDLKWIEKMKSRVVKKNVRLRRRWTDFLGEVVLVFRADDRSEDDVETSLVGLMTYRIRKREDLLIVSDKKVQFRTKLERNGDLKAISDKLFKKYVAPELGIPAISGT